MSEIRAIVVSPEEAHGGPWLIDTTSLTHALDEANRLAAY